MTTKLPTQYQEFIHLSRYARWNEDKQRRETWEETVKRYFDFFEKHLQRIKHIHFKDLRLQVLENINFQSESFLKSVLKGVFTVPGDGGIDFVSIGNVIKASGYEGWIIVEAEQDPVIYNPLELAISSKKYLDKIWSN